MTRSILALHNDTKNFLEVYEAETYEEAIKKASERYPSNETTILGAVIPLKIKTKAREDNSKQLEFNFITKE